MPLLFFYKMVVETLEECDFLVQICFFICFNHIRDPLCLVMCDLNMVITMLVKAGDLAPVDRAIFSLLAMEHVWVDAADTHSVRVNGAPAVRVKEITPPIIVGPERVPGGIENSILIAKSKVRSRDESLRIDCLHPHCVIIKEADMVIELAGAASPTTGAGKTNILDDGDQLCYGIGEEDITFIFEVLDPAGNPVLSGISHLYLDWVYREKGVVGLFF